MITQQRIPGLLMLTALDSPASNIHAGRVLFSAELQDGGEYRIQQTVGTPDRPDDGTNGAVWTWTSELLDGGPYTEGEAEAALAALQTIYCEETAAAPIPFPPAATRAQQAA